MARGVNSRRGIRNNNTNSKKAGLLAAAVAGVLATSAFYARPASAGTFTWDTTKSGNWSDASDWGGTAPTGADNTDQLIFGGSGSTAYTSTIDAFVNPWIINGLVLNSSATVAETINNTNTAGIQLAGASPFIAQNGSGAFNISAPIAMGATTTFGGSGSGITTLSGVISGANQLVVNSGSWRITNANNSWTGGLSVGSGALVEFAATGTNASIAMPAAAASFYGNGGTITINGGEVRFTPTGTGTGSGTIFTTNNPSKAFVFGPNGGILNLNGRIAAQGNAAIPVTLNNTANNIAVIKFNGGDFGLSDTGTPANWNLTGSNLKFVAGQLTGTGPLRVELTNGALHLIGPRTAGATTVNLDMPYTIRGVLGGDPSSGPDGVIQSGTSKNMGRATIDVNGTLNFRAGFFLEDAVAISPANAARAIDGNIVVRGTASGHPGNISFQGRSTGTAFSDGTHPPIVNGVGTLVPAGTNQVGHNVLYIGVGGDDTLTIQDGGIAALDIRQRTDQNFHHGVILNAKTVINGGGKLVFRQSIANSSRNLDGTAMNPAVVFATATPNNVGYHSVQGNIQGEGTSTKESVIDLYLPFDNTVADDIYGGVSFESTSNLIINGSGTGGLRVNGLSRPSGLFGGLGAVDPIANNQKVQDFLTPARLSALTGSGGYLTIAPSGSTYIMAGGSEWAPGVTVGLKVVNSNTTGDDLLLQSGFTHNILVDSGATLNANGQTLGPAAVTPGLGRVWGSGTLAGNATIDVGGRIAPGTSVGTMSASGDLIINGTYEAEVTDPANDLLNVAGTLTLGSTSVLDLPGSNTYGYSPYTIATYGALSGTFGTISGIPSGPTGPLYGIDYSNGQIRLVFIAAQQKIWSGSDGAHPTFWDNNTTANWNGGAAKYVNANHDNVTFDDSATSGNVVVTGGDVLPSTIIVDNNALNYTISSSAGNAIAGTTGFEKRGNGSLTLSGPNSFTGTMRVKNGRVSVAQLSNGGVSGPLGAGTQIQLGDTPLNGEGTLQYTGAADASTDRAIVVSGLGGVFDVTNNVTTTFSGVVSGDSNITKRGAGTTALTNAANTITGGINIEQGTLRLGSMGAGTVPFSLGTNSTSGTLDYTGGTFTDTRGIFINSGGGTIRVSNAATNLSFNGDLTADTISKRGPGTLTLNGRVFLTAASHTVAEGTLSLTNSSNSIASPSSFTVPTGATLASRPSAMSSATVKLTGGTLRVNTDASGLLGQFYKTVVGEITPDNTGVNAGGSSVFNSPGNFNTHFNSISPSQVVNTTATNSATAFVSNNAGNGNPLLPWGVDLGNDYVTARWSGKINLPTTGSYNFWTSSDDGSVMFIDGVKVVDFNRLGGFAESPVGTANLSAGVHDIMIAFYENAGGAGIEARWQPPGGVKDFLPNNILLANADQTSASFGGNNVEVTANSTIDNPIANNSMMGSLTMGPLTLTHTGNGATRFTGTTLTGAAGSTANFNVAGGILDLGPVTAAGSRVLNKTGVGNLVIQSGAAALASGSTVNVSGGNLVLVQDTSGPAVLGNNAVTLDAGATGLQISSKGGDLTFTNPIIANDNVRIAAFATDGGIVGPLNVTLGSASNGITVNGGKTITLSTDSDYNMSVVGLINGASGINIASGSGVMDFVTSQNTGTLAVNAGTLRLSTPQTATVATTVGGLGGNYATVQGNAVLTSPSLTLGNRGTWNANIPSGLPAPVTVNTGGILNANVANALQGVTATVSGGNAQFWVDGGIGSGSVTLSNNGTITGRVAETGGDPANVRTLPTFAIAAGQSGNLAADRDGGAVSVAGRVVAPAVNMGAGSTMNLIANNSTTLHAATINIGGGNATLINNASDTRVTIGSINGGSTAINMTGAQRMKVLGDVTAANVTVNTAALDFDPGASGTSHVATPIQVNSILSANTGTVDMGSNVITGDPTRSLPGLVGRFYQLAAAPVAANYNTLTALNAAYTDTAPVAPFVARTTAGGNTTMNFPFINDTAGDPVGEPFAILGFHGINTFAGVFRGQIFLPPSGSNTFFLRSDDGSVMFLAGGTNPFINNNGDHGAATVSATSTLSGWQDVVIGYYENTGTAGLRLAQGADADANSVNNAMLRTLDPAGYFGGSVNVESNAKLIAGGVTTLGAINFNGASGPASVTFSNTSVQSGTVSNINVTGTGALTLGANNTLVAENLNVPDGATLEKDGAGTLRVSNGQTLGSGATVGVSGGRLLLNGIGTGNGSVLVRSGGTLGGGGSLAGSATVLGGGHLAPGSSIGTLTLGGLDFEDGAKIDLEGGAAGFDKIKIASDGTSDVFTLNGVTSINLSDLGGLNAADYIIIDYNNANVITDALSHLTLSNPNAFAGITFSLLNDTANKDIVLHGVASGPPQWNVDGNGSWGVAGNWTGGIPGAGNTANFLGKITAARTITLDGNRTVQSVNFDNANSYTIAAGSGGTLTVGNGTSGTISVVSGTHVISAGLAFAGNVTKSGAGTLTINGPQSHGAGAALTVNQGRVNLNSNAGTPGSAAGSNLSLSVGGGAASVVLGASQDLKALNVSFADAGAQTLDLASPAGGFNSVSVYAADLAAAKASLYSAIVNANQAGAADVTDGIIDSGLHSSSGIGLAQQADSIMIRATRIGDVNLDGNVSIADFLQLAGNFGTVGSATWQEGDVNYDRNVSIADFLALAGNFGSSYTGSAAPVSAADLQTLSNFASSIGVDPAVIGSAVPEPGTLSLLAIGAVGLMPRRRRRN